MKLSPLSFKKQSRNALSLVAASALLSVAATSLSANAQSPQDGALQDKPPHMMGGPNGFGPAHDRSMGKRHKGDHSAHLSKILKKLDTNQDGSITKAEFDVKIATEFDTTDTDRNGQLSQAERNARHAARFQEHKNMRFAALDSNGDNFISRAEYDANTPSFADRQIKRTQKAADKSDRRQMRKDRKEDFKKLSKKERKTMRKKMQKMRKKFDNKRVRLDVNNDGLISRGEFVAKKAQHFSRMDFDKNGVINKADFDARQKTFKANFDGRHPGFRDGK